MGKENQNKNCFSLFICMRNFETHYSIHTRIGNPGAVSHISQGIRNSRLIFIGTACMAFNSFLECFRKMLGIRSAALRNCRCFYFPLAFIGRVISEVYVAYFIVYPTRIPNVCVHLMDQRVEFPRGRLMRDHLICPADSRHCNQQLCKAHLLVSHF